MNVTVKFNLLPRSGFAILPLETGADKELDIEDVEADSGLFAPCSVLWFGSCLKAWIKFPNTNKLIQPCCQQRPSPAPLSEGWWASDSQTRLLLLQDAGAHAAAVEKVNVHSCLALLRSSVDCRSHLSPQGDGKERVQVPPVHLVPPAVRGETSTQTLTSPGGHKPFVALTALRREQGSGHVWSW